MENLMLVIDLGLIEKLNHQELVLYLKEMYYPQFQRNLKIIVVQNDFNFQAQAPKIQSKLDQFALIKPG
jgi:hypothetical protein